LYATILRAFRKTPMAHVATPYALTGRFLMKRERPDLVPIVLPVPYRRREDRATARELTCVAPRTVRIPAPAPLGIAARPPTLLGRHREHGCFLTHMDSTLSVCS
jgi:hypothetical protein